MKPVEIAAEDFRRVARMVVEDVQKRAALEISLQSLDQLKNRIQTRGEKADGSKFKAYSQAKVPYWYFAGRSRTGSDQAIRRLKGSIKKPQGDGYHASYEQWRRANNLQTRHKDFRFTGDLWRSIKPYIRSESVGEVEIEINATNPKERQKVDWISDQQGEILELSPSELQQIEDDYLQRNLELLEELLT